MLMVQDKLVLCTVLGSISYALMIYILLDDTQRMGQTRLVPELHTSFNLYFEEIVTLSVTSIVYCISHTPVSKKSSHNVPSPSISSIPSISLIPTPTYLITSHHSKSYIHIIVNHG
jgi:hypothetical protein